MVSQISYKINYYPSGYNLSYNIDLMKKLWHKGNEVCIMSVKNILNKIFSYHIELSNRRAVYVYKFLGIKLKHVLRRPLLNQKFCKKHNIKTLLLVRDDGMGDFIITRPYIKSIKESRKYSDYKIILAGTPQMIEIAKKYDSQYISDYIVLNYNKKNLRPLIKMAKKMSFNTIINPSDSKVNIISETLIKYAKADDKVCHLGFFTKGDLNKYKTRVAKVINSYNRHISTGEEVLFIKDREKLFFEQLLGEKLSPVPELKEFSDIDSYKDYIVISAFARSKHRTYSAENFVKIIDYITENLHYPVILIGSGKETKRAQNIKDACINSDLVFNIAGKVSLSEAIHYIRKSIMLIANETGTVHIAHNYGIKTVCISNGSFMNVFHPYPEKNSCISYIYPENIEKYIKNNDCEGIQFEYDINNIPPEVVINEVNKVLNNADSKILTLK